MYSVPLFYMTVRLMTPSDAGRHMIPNSFFGSGASLATGFIVRHTGKYYWLTFACGAIGCTASIMLYFWDQNAPE